MNGLANAKRMQPTNQNLPALCPTSPLRCMDCLDAKRSAENLRGTHLNKLAEQQPSKRLTLELSGARYAHPLE